MRTYAPDCWILLKIKSPKETFFKVLGGWYGGFAGSNSWRANSGITKFEKVKGLIKFYGNSGSCYECPENEERASMLMESVLKDFQEDGQRKGYEVEVVSFENFEKEFVPE